MVPATVRFAFYSCCVEDWLNFNIMNTSHIDNSLVWCNVWATGCYLLWFWRNKQIHEDNYSRPPYPSRHVLAAAQEYDTGLSLRRSVGERNFQTAAIGWRANRADMVVLNTDGAMKTALGISACGGVLRDVQRWLGGFAKRLHVTSAFLAEMWGVLEGLNLAAAKGFNRIQLQSDSKSLVQCLSSNSHGVSLVVKFLIGSSKSWLLSILFMSLVFTARLIQLPMRLPTWDAIVKKG